MSQLQLTNSTELSDRTLPLERPRGDHPAAAFAWAPAVVCTLALCLGAWSGAAAEWLEPWVWVAALGVLGMPHGSADWRVFQAVRARRGQRAGVVAFTPYLLFMAGGTLALVVFPVWTVLLFFVLTALHFGLEDVDYAGNRSHTSMPVLGVRGLMALARGGPVLLLPFAADPQSAWLPFGLLIGSSLHGDALGTISAWCTAGFVVCAIGLALGLIANPLAWNTRQRVRFAIETAAAWLMLVMLPPLLAVGVYFVAIHAWKHTRRLSERDDVAGYAALTANASHARNHWLYRMLRIHRVGLVFTVLALAAVLPWSWWLGGVGPVTLASASIGFYIITTLPHHLLGERLFKQPSASSIAEPGTRMTRLTG